jgi:hypothetical protein
MSQSKLHEASAAGAVEGETVDYRPLSVAAIAGLAAGLASPLAFVHPLFWSVPLLAVLISVAALVRIRRYGPKLIGRRAAMVGLVVALGCGASAPTYWSIYQYQLRSQARSFCLSWFNLLQTGEPHKAHQLTVTSYARLPPDDNLWSHYAGEDVLYSGLRTYTQTPVVRALLELGPQARVRYGGSPLVTNFKEREIVRQLYAVSFRRNGKLRSFLVEITVTRVFNNVSNTHEWMIDHMDLLDRFPSSVKDKS